MLLETKTVEKPWGKDLLPAPFATPPGKRIGEIWFEPPADLPQLLVKYLFTSEKLSVQVHPSDTQTLAAGLGRQGKEECWLVIDAEPGATLGIGFKGEVDADRSGYVPNVVYTCGVLEVGERLLVPYGISDSAVGFATVEIAALLDLMV